LSRNEHCRSSKVKSNRNRPIEARKTGASSWVVFCRGPVDSIGRLTASMVRCAPGTCFACYVEFIWSEGRRALVLPTVYLISAEWQKFLEREEVTCNWGSMNCDCYRARSPRCSGPPSKRNWFNKGSVRLSNGGPRWPSGDRHKGSSEEKPGRRLGQAIYLAFAWGAQTQGDGRQNQSPGCTCGVKAALR